jgi:hypothetical protein
VGAVLISEFLLFCMAGKAGGWRTSNFPSRRRFFKFLQMKLSLDLTNVVMMIIGGPILH